MSNYVGTDTVTQVDADIIADVDFWYEATGDANVLTSSITNYENDDYDDDPTDAADEDDHI